MPDTLDNPRWPTEEHISGLEVCMWDLTLQKPGTSPAGGCETGKRRIESTLGAVFNLNDLGSKIIFFITGWLDGGAEVAPSNANVSIRLPPTL